MRQLLPWDSVPPPVYAAQQLKPRKRWVQIGGWVLIVVLLLFGLTSRDRNALLSGVSLVFAVLYLITMLTKKDAVITQRGLEIFYQMQITTHYDFISWEEINSIVREDRGHDKLVRLHIGYGGASEKALFFPYADANAICEMAKEKNPSIRVLDFNTSRPEKPAKQQHKKKR